MRKRLIFAAGMGVGYVLGTRAGREKFDRMVAQAHKFWESPTVQEAAGVVQAQANKVYGEGKQALSLQLRKVYHRSRAERDLVNAGLKATNTEEWDASGRSHFHADAF
jgi:hypothetical protein